MTAIAGKTPTAMTNTTWMQGATGAAAIASTPPTFAADAAAEDGEEDEAVGEADGGERGGDEDGEEFGFESSVPSR